MKGTGWGVQKEGEGYLLLLFTWKAEGSERLEPCCDIETD
jgi:hypothetical protein